MKTHGLKGSKQQIAEGIIGISGEVREAIVFVEEPSGAADSAAASTPDDLFAEMRPYMVDVREVDDSREAIYSRLEGE